MATISALQVLHHHVEHAVITPTNHSVLRASKVTASWANSVRGNTSCLADGREPRKGTHGGKGDGGKHDSGTGPARMGSVLRAICRNDGLAVGEDLEMPWSSPIFALNDH